ncbi:hypothetical protein Ac2012v2_005834 [Leucoagaricus gongylophorus]
MSAVLLIMAGALGISSFVCGLIPLSASISRKNLNILNALAPGLLIGTALGIIIPEGVEVLAVPAKDRLESLRLYIANNLIIGFLLMMVVEHLMVGNHNHGPDLTRGGGTQLEFDAELGELETDQHGHSERRTAENMRRPVANQVVAPPKQKAIPFTIGLIIHGMADGCALGVSAFEGTSSQNSDGISLIIFLALLFHKAPTSMAFAVSLLSTNLPRADCKKHLAIFASSTPLGAVSTFFLLSFFGLADSNELVGSALLISGGTFLYVATVLQPTSQHQPETQELKPSIRLFLVVIGTVMPLCLGNLIGHGH